MAGVGGAIHDHSINKLKNIHILPHKKKERMNE